MCGRFSLQANESDILKAYNAEAGNNFSWSPLNEVFPTQRIPAVIRQGQNRVGLLSWGITVPGGGQPIINARVETLEEKRMFKNAFMYRRCLIPVDGFYEWKEEGNQKTKYLISRKDKSLFSLAGIYDSFAGPEGITYWATVIVTAPSEGEISTIHHRMPVLVVPELEELWLCEGKEKPEYIKEKVISKIKTEDLNVEKVS